MTTSDDATADRPEEHNYRTHATVIKAAMEALQAELDLLKGRPNAEFDLLMAEIETFGRPGKALRTDLMMSELAHAVVRLKRFAGKLPPPPPSRLGPGLSRR